MKISSNQIITIIVAFLVGLLVAFAFTGEKDKSPEATEEATTEEAMEAEGEAVEGTEAAAPTETSGESSAAATTSTPKPTYTGTCAPTISGNKDSRLNAIVLHWTPCYSDDFQFYKIVKSSKNANPSYPADSVVVSSSNKDLTNHVDKTVARATTYYYRACVVQRLNKVNCGNVTTITY